MAFIDMVDEVGGSVPKLPRDYAYTAVNEAWLDICRKNLWSFNIFDGNWTAPAPINAGSVATVQGLNTVTFNAAAIAAISAAGVFGPPTPLTQRQFRIGVGTIYSIWAYNATTGVATLDRKYQEAGAAAASYVIAQYYYPCPVPDLRNFESIVDRLNFNPLGFGHNRAWLDERDPQRSLALSYIPTEVVPYQVDLNPTSPTKGYMLFEMWGLPQYPLTWDVYLVRKGMPLVNPDDTLPSPVGEDVVKALAKMKAYAWAEANKGDQPRAVGSDFKFLIGDAMAEYKRLYREYRLQDWGTIKLWKTRLRRRCQYPLFPAYSSVSGTASPGPAW